MIKNNERVVMWINHQQAEENTEGFSSVFKEQVEAGCQVRFDIISSWGAKRNLFIYLNLVLKKIF
jgi:hypothetical protein